MAAKRNGTFAYWSAGYLAGLRLRYWNFEFFPAPMREFERQAIEAHVAKFVNSSLFFVGSPPFF